MRIPVKLVLIPIVLVLMSFLAAGCFGSDSEVTVPQARVGDEVSFQVTQRIDTHFFNQTSVRNVTITIEGDERITLPDGRDVDTVVGYLETDDSTHMFSTYRFYVHKDSLGLVRFDSLCSWFSTGGCSPVVHLYDERGAPWAYGSSLFQGRTFTSGSPVTLQERIDGDSVRLEAVPVGGSPGGQGHRMRVGPLDGTTGVTRGLSPLAAEVVISSDNPYVLRSEMHIPVENPTRDGTHEVHRVVEQTRYEAGTGPRLVRTEAAPDWTPCVDEVKQPTGILPPGGDHEFEGLNTSFQAFVDYLNENHSGFEEHASRPGAIIESIRMRPFSATTTALGLMDERHDLATVIWPEDNKTARVVDVVKETRATLVPPGEETHYYVSSESTEETVAPVSHTPTPLASVADVAEHHQETYRDGTGDVELRMSPRVDYQGEVSALDPRLEWRYAAEAAPGEPSLFEVYEHDLSTGCLVIHEPGVRN